MSSNPFIRLGEKMKYFFRTLIYKDFGNVSDAKGLYNIITLYKRYVPEQAKRKINGGRRLKRNHGFK